MQFMNSKSTLGFSESSAFFKFTSKATSKKKTTNQKTTFIHSLPFFHHWHQVLNRNFDVRFNYKTILLSDFNIAI